MSTISRYKRDLKTGEKALIRSAVEEDAASLLEIRRSVVAEGKYTLVEADEFKLTEEKVRQAIHERAEAQGGVYLVVEVDDEVVGLLEFQNGHYRRTAHSGMFSVWVRKEWRGRGVGTALLQVLIDWATKSPLIEKVTLAVFSTNHRAIGLYRKLGFEVEGRCPRDMKLADGKYMDSVLMYRFVNQGEGNS
jgi:RimJ/RimL family protein N-acetyltransferase